MSFAAMTQIVEEQRQKNIARREAHPDWPAHITTLTTSDPRDLGFDRVSPIYKIMVNKEGTRWLAISQTLPVAKIARCRAHCKYCYSTHGDWWMMDRRDYQFEFEDDPIEPPVILCGKCEHTSRADFAGLAAKHYQTRKDGKGI